MLLPLVFERMLLSFPWHDFKWLAVKFELTNYLINFNGVTLCFS